MGFLRRRLGPWLALAAGCTPTPATPLHSDSAAVDAPLDVPAGLGPTVLYDRSPARLGALEVDDDYFYWAERSVEGFRIIRAPKEGGAVTPLGTWSGSDVGIQLIGVDASSVFWVEDSKVNRYDKVDGKLTSIELGPAPRAGGWRIVVDGDHIYFADRGCLTFGRVAKEGGSPVYIAVTDHTDPGGGARLAVDSTSVFCGNGMDLLMAPKEGGSAIKLAIVANTDLVGPMSSDGAFVYWVSNRANLGTGQENLAMISKAGGPVTDLGRIGLAASQVRLDVARQKLYGSSSGTLNRDIVFSLSLTDKSIDRLAENQTVWGGLAQDRQYLYWCSQTALMRTSK
jgi:hypothetical protein